VTVGTGL